MRRALLFAITLILGTAVLAAAASAPRVTSADGSQRASPKSRNGWGDTGRHVHKAYAVAANLGLQVYSIRLTVETWKVCGENVTRVSSTPQWDASALHNGAELDFLGEVHITKVGWRFVQGWGIRDHLGWPGYRTLSGNEKTQTKKISTPRGTYIDQVRIRSYISKGGPFPPPPASYVFTDRVPLKVWVKRGTLKPYVDC